MAQGIVETERLRLLPMTVEGLDALIAGDRFSLEDEVGATFPSPLVPPPETGDVLGYFRDIVARADDWLPCFIVLREPPTVVGSCGAMPPDVDGRAVIGYGVYPEHEGRGYATEAARGLVSLLDGHLDVSVIVATIHPHNLASRRVAEKAGLRPTGRFEETDDGRVEFWERRVSPTPRTRERRPGGAGPTRP